MRKAIVAGITGQHGAHLADPLSSEAHDVLGLVRRLSAAVVDDHRLPWPSIADCAPRLPASPAHPLPRSTEARHR